MGLELIYTSARKGLKPGSLGFCTVAMSRQMSPSLAAALESLSGYRHLFMAGHASYAQNPVNFCHYLVPDRGRLVRVIARISSAPADYTGRTNKLAHFMVLDATELAAAGPAWLLQRPSLIMEVWSGEPRWLDNATPIPTGDSVPARCTAWERVTGDAGWAGNLLQRFCDQPEVPVHIICNPGTPMLDLFAEALALLPKESRWQIAFSTYFTGLPVAGIKCHWRGVVAGAPSTTGDIDPKSVIDLTRSLGRAPDGPCNVAARAGNIIDPSRIRPPAITMEAPARLAMPPGPPARKAGDAKYSDTGTLDMAPLDAEMAAPRLFHPNNQGHAGGELHTSHKRRWIWLAVLGALVLIILIAAGTFFLIPYLRSARQLAQAALVANIPGNEKAISAKAAATQAAAKANAAAAKAAAANAAAANAAAAKAAAAKAAAAKAAAAKAAAAKAKAAKANAAAAKAAATQAAAKANAAKAKAAKAQAAAETPTDAGIQRPLKVVDVPIFASSLSVGAHRFASAAGVTRLRVRIPPPGKTGNLILTHNPMVKAGKWQNATALSGSGPAVRVRWKANATTSAGPLTVGSDSLAKIRVLKGAILTVVYRGGEPSEPGRHREPGRHYVKQMVVDVRLKSGGRQRIQFLSDREFSRAYSNHPEIIHLTRKTPASINIASSLKSSLGICLVKESLRPSSLGTAAHAGKGEKKFSIDLGRGSISGAKPRVLSFKIGGGQVDNNFKKLWKTINRRLRYWKRKVKAGQAKVDSDTKKIKACESKIPAKVRNKNPILTLHRKTRTRDEAVLRRRRASKDHVDHELSRLNSLNSIKFRVELYPHGPVLERFTFKRAGK